MAALPLCELAVTLNEPQARLTLAASQWWRRREYEAAAHEVLAREFGDREFHLEVHTFGDLSPQQAPTGVAVGD